MIPLQLGVLKNCKNKVRKRINDTNEAVKNRKAPIGIKLVKEMNDELYKMFFWWIAVDKSLSLDIIFLSGPLSSKKI